MRRNASASFPTSSRPWWAIVWSSSPRASPSLAPTICIEGCYDPPGDDPENEDADEGNSQTDDDKHEDHPDQTCLEVRLKRGKIILVDAGADDPIPGFVVSQVGNFPTGSRFALVQPGVALEATSPGARANAFSTIDCTK